MAAVAVTFDGISIVRRCLMALAMNHGKAMVR
jgi:hypothetical protein